MMKSFSRAKWALVLAIRSTMGETCSTRESGNSSDIHRLALNLGEKGRTAAWVGPNPTGGGLCSLGTLF